MNTKKLILSAAVLVGGVVISSQSVLAYQGDPTVQGPNYSAETHDAVETAIESGDYATWSELVSGNGRMKEVITEENFAQFAEAHRLTLEGKTDEAAAIRAELGLGLRNGQGNGNGSGQGSQNGLRDGSGQRMRGSNNR